MNRGWTLLNSPKIAPYGSWKSPITSDLIVEGSVGLGQPSFDGDDIYWMEMRPKEAGRNVIVKRSSNGSCVGVNQPPINARTKVHEYGGGDYIVKQGIVCFSNFSDQRLYRQDGPGAIPQPLTAPGDVRYADSCLDQARGRLICVREDHTREGTEAVNSIVSVNLQPGDNHGTVLVEGNDFYSTPRLSPDGTQLAWLTWNHPNMPWDGCELWVGEFAEDGTLASTRWVAGGAAESIFQPEWSPDGVLYFASDRSGWWNLERITPDGGIERVCQSKAELGMPQWVFGMSSYAFVSPEIIVCSHVDQGVSTFATIDTGTGKLTPVDCPYTDIQYLRAAKGQAVFRGGSPTDVAAIVRFNLGTGHFETLRRSNDLETYPQYFSVPRAIEFPTEGGLTAHGFFYPPQNPDYRAPDNEKPPLIVKSHGGPTAAASTALSLSIQYWTSRGFAVLDVNYGGSTGYGRQYRERLNRKWGIVDVDDCVNGARYLAERGEVDGNRLIITGGSAGGYTTLCALTFKNVFRAGASHFGISNTESMARDTHKYESQYLTGLLGPYPERKDIYYDRSPINFPERLSCPVIFFQGLEDKVVPANQAETMVDAIRAKGIPVSYVAFAGEQHGFRQAKHIKRTLDGELYFYSKVFRFALADPVEPVEIENL
ncbi:MAG TPA: S9 family peptidase [Pyrinomonadaceae bacterium]|jgi:dipeptidyl aminopeptidase/acylaminoacyl peptidase|nr:S9 family peptidase [Pyrinomonadaceae bacterium]